MTQNYHISSSDYLRRATERLSENTHEGLFYAAYELRCGIEARMQEYLAAQDHISKSMKRGWQIAKLGRNIEKAFKSGNRIAEITIKHPETGDPIMILYYTPVTKELRDLGESLGEYMHAQQKYRASSDPWWQSFRDRLQNILTQLEVANRGSLLGPPLKNQNTGQLSMQVQFPDDQRDKHNFLMAMMQEGTVHEMEIRYLDAFEPEDQA